MKKLEPIIHDDKNGLDYILVGDYYIPLICVEEENRDIGFYGSLRRVNNIRNRVDEVILNELVYV